MRSMLEHTTALRYFKDIMLDTQAWKMHQLTCMLNLKELTHASPPQDGDSGCRAAHKISML